MKNPHPHTEASPQTPESRTCVVIDDEEMNRVFLMSLLRSHFPEITVLGETDSVRGAVALIRETDPDIVFLDTEIIGGTGFEVLDAIPEQRSAIILIAPFPPWPKGDHRYANAGFLLKPIALHELRAALAAVKAGDRTIQTRTRKGDGKR
jgi:two-component system, LytTR family, response regulator